MLGSLLLPGSIKPNRDYPMPEVLQRRSGRRVPLLPGRVHMVATVDEDARTGYALSFVVEIRLAGHF